MAKLTGDPRFGYDAYRRLVQMFGTVVIGIPDEPFEAVLAGYRAKRGVDNDADLGAEDLAAITREFKSIVQRSSGREFPADPLEQLKLATEAVFKSWNGKRAIDYRNAAGIAHDLGTAVNIVTMVFGNMGRDSGTGVVTTRNVTTGENEIEGDFLINAQGEDVVAGIRAPNASPLSSAGCPGSTRSLTASASNWKSTTARSRTSSSPSSAADCGSSRPETPSAPRRPRCGSPWTWRRRN